MNSTAIGLILLSHGSLRTAMAWVTMLGPSAIPSFGDKNAAVFDRKHSSKLPYSRNTATTTALFYSSGFDNNEISNSNSTDSSSLSTTPLSFSSSPLSSSVVERLRVNGVSVSPKGFHVLLESTPRGRKTNNNGIRKGADDEATTNESSTGEKDHLSMQTKNGEDTNKHEHKPASNRGKSNRAPNTHDKRANNSIGTTTVLPLKMTNDPADAYAATSPESLTLCQLLSGVDMAGAILPPELLGTIVACHIEDKIDAMYEDEDDENYTKKNKNKPSDDNAIFTPVLSPIEGKIWEYLQNQQALLQDQNLLFGSQPKQDDALSASSPLKHMPRVTLDQLTLVPSPSCATATKDRHGAASWQCKLECALPEWKETIGVEIKADVLASLVYNYDPESSPLFTCIALALRYKAPIVLEQPQPPQPSSSTTTTTSSTAAAAAAAALFPKPQEQEPLEPPPQNHQYYYWWYATKDDLDRDFPQRTTLENLRVQSTRVTRNIETGFAIHKLTGALQIAMRLGDATAAEKIRAKLDEYDSMEDLPTTATTINTNTNNNGNKENGRLDDPEHNILQ